MNYEIQTLEQYSNTVQPKGHIREPDDVHELTIYPVLDAIEAEPLDSVIYA